MLLIASSASAQMGPPETTPCTGLLRLPHSEPAGVYADYARVAELAGAAPLRPRVIRRPSDERELAVCEDGRPIPWVERLRADSVTDGLRLALVPPRSFSRGNSAYPADRHDGALWAGRGISTSLEGGAAAVWALGDAVLSAALAPRLIFQQNREFETITDVAPTGYSPYIYPWHPAKIDWPQRFGDAEFWTLDPGQSWIRIDAYGWTLGFSNENLWWGPATRYPLLMSSTAPGFPHVFAGTSRPLATPVGGVEGRLIWGRLTESEYFDKRDWNDHRLFAGIVLDYEPRGLPGLFLGFARAYLVAIPPEGLAPSDYLLRPYTDLRSNPGGAGNPLADNQLISIFVRWAFPEAGFEAYAEWAREDRSGGIDDLIISPDHGQAYALGFQKVVPTGGRWVRLYGELAYLQSASTSRSGRPAVVFYTHSPLVQGYTHRGQLLGAPIGPGSDAQLLGADLFADWGRLGLYLERVRQDGDAYYLHWARYYGALGHDIRLTAGLRHQFFLGDLHIGWGLAVDKRRNRSFVGFDRLHHPGRVERNWALDLDVTWSPAPRRAPRKPTVSTRTDGH